MVEKVLDCRGMRSPKPLMETRNAIVKLARGDRLVILVSDIQCKKVIPVYIQALGHRILSIDDVREDDDEYIRITIELT